MALDASNIRQPEENARLPPRPAKSDLTSDEKKRRLDCINAIISLIWDLYDAGTPLFTRDELLHIDYQLDHVAGVRSGQRNAILDVTGLDGRSVTVATESGVVYASGSHPDIVRINMRPCIEYWPIERLTGRGRWHILRFQPECALLPLRISYISEARYCNPDNGAICAYGRTTVASLAQELASMVSEGRRTLGEKSPCDRTAEQTSILFRQHKDAWKAGNACHRLHKTLLRAFGPRLNSSCVGSRLTIRRIVAFGLASMANGSKLASARHATQHAMILTVRDVVQKLQDGLTRDAANGIECFAQDPDYTPADTKTLADIGITVLSDPRGFLAIDDTTIVIAVAPDVPVRQIVVDLARPAAMIWTRLDPGDSIYGENKGDKRDDRNDRNDRLTDLEDVGGWSDPASSRVKAMLRGTGGEEECGYSEWPFPEDVGNFGIVQGIAMYVRNPPRCGTSSRSSGSSASVGSDTGGFLSHWRQRLFYHMNKKRTI